MFLKFTLRLLVIVMYLCLTLMRIISPHLGHPLDTSGTATFYSLGKVYILFKIRARLSKQQSYDCLIYGMKTTHFVIFKKNNHILN